MESGTSAETVLDGVPKNFLLLMLAVVFFLPFSIDTAPAESSRLLSISSFIWRIGVMKSGIIIVEFAPYFLTPSVMFLVVKLIFVREIHKLYMGKSSRTYALGIGIFSEVQFFLLYDLPLIYSYWRPDALFTTSLIFPLPILFVLVLTLMRHRSPPIITSPWDGLSKEYETH
jgi:hypothetical protein